MNKWLLGFSLCAFVLIGKAQDPDTSRYFIYFKDKGADNPYSVSNPQAFLTQRSIDRRSKQGIEIIESDLPVNPNYVLQLDEADVNVFFTSRWLNGALVQMHLNQVESIQALEFIDSVRLIARGARLTKNPVIPDPPTNFELPAVNEGDSDIQLIMMGADLMHADNIKGQGMLIAVLDNGYRGVNRYTPFQHIWENNQLVASKDFVENSGNVFQFGSHGTAVFSTIGANFTTDTTNFFGVAYEADFILCVTEDSKAENTIEEYNWLLGAEFADSLGADVINSSVGYRLFDIDEHNYTYDDLDGQTTVNSIAAGMAAKSGMIVATSAGNDGDNNGWNRINTPADANGVLTVGSANVDFTYSPFSSIGPSKDGRTKPDVSAFGNGTLVMRGNGDIERGGGTSFASPLIAGFAACIWQANPDKTNYDVMWAIRNSGHQSDNPDNYLGYGVPNYIYAKDVKALSVKDIFDDKFTIFPNPFLGDTLYLLTDEEFQGDMEVKIIDPTGSTVYNKKFQQSEIKERMELSLDSSIRGVYFLSLQTDKGLKVVKLIKF